MTGYASAAASHRPTCSLRRSGAEMAEELQVILWCDVCLGDGKRTAGQAYRIGGIRVDLCEGDAAVIDAAAQLLRDFGRPDNGAPAPDDQLACPECGKTYKGRSGLGSHRRRMHGVPGEFSRDSAERPSDAAEQPPGGYPCPECDRVFDSPQGRGAHRYRAHGATASKL